MRAILFISVICCLMQALFAMPVLSDLRGELNLNLQAGPAPTPKPIPATSPPTLRPTTASPTLLPSLVPTLAPTPAPTPVGYLTNADVARMTAAVLSLVPAWKDPWDRTTDPARAKTLGEIVEYFWHDAGTYNAATKTGGPDGCVDMTTASNIGRQGIHDQLFSVYKPFAPIVSWADFLVIAANAAVIEALPLNATMSLPFKKGRVTAPTCNDSTPGFLAKAEGSIQQVTSLAGRLGISLREMTALIGAHTLGRCFPQNSGYNGSWTRTEAQFDNKFWVDIRDEAWERRSTTTWLYNDVTKVNTTVSRHWWFDPKDPFNGRIMLNTDMALGYDIGNDTNVNDANHTCIVLNFGNPATMSRVCPPQSAGTRQVVDAYIADESLFHREFAAAFVKLAELGWEGKLQEVTVIPTATPTVGPKSWRPTFSPNTPTTPGPTPAKRADAVTPPPYNGTGTGQASKPL